MTEMPCYCGHVREENSETGGIIVAETDYREMELSLSNLLNEYMNADDKSVWLRNYLGTEGGSNLEGESAILAVVEGSTRGLEYRDAIQCPACARLSIFNDERDDWDEYAPVSNFSL